MPPLGLGYLATALLKRGYEVVILDAHAERLDMQSVIKRINEVDPDVLGITMFSTDVSVVDKISEIIKRNRPNTITLAGGPHPSSAPYEVLNQLKWIDYAFQGEGEISVPKFIDCLTSKKDITGWANKIPGLIYRTEKGIICNEPIFYENVDSFGHPPWGTVLDLSLYHKFMPTFQARTMKSAPIVVTRGCPYRCTFCVGYKISGRKMRSRSLESVISEIKLLYYKFKVEEILITDDNFIHNSSFVIEFCKSLIENNIKIKWTMHNGIRLNSLTEEILPWMKKSGCHSIVLGIESGSQKILNNMKKGLNLNLIREKVSLVRRCSLPIHAFFILGYPDETIEDIMKTKQLALELDLVGATFSLFCPLPGSEITEQLKSEKKIEYSSLHLSKGSLAIPVYSPDSISIKKLKRIQQMIMIQFYLRPKIIFYYIKMIFPLKRTLYFIRVGIKYFSGR
jgi:radical SAM superfamily enzyme YgiQ (UPF0313 family)